MIVVTLSTVATYAMRKLILLFRTKQFVLPSLLLHNAHFGKKVYHMNFKNTYILDEDKKSNRS